MADISDNQLSERFALEGSWLLRQRDGYGFSPGRLDALPTVNTAARDAMFWHGDNLVTVSRNADGQETFSQVTLSPSVVNSDDPTTSIQAAIDAVAGEIGESTGGGTVYLPPGTYTVGTLELRQHVRLMGAGEGTVLRAKANIGGPVITNADQADRFITVSDLRIDGNKANQSTGSNRHGIHFDLDDVSGDEYADTYWLLQRVTVLNCKDRGVFIEGRGEGFANTVIVRDCDDVGFYLDAPDCGLTFVRVSGSGKQGIYLNSSNTVGSLCKAFYNGLIDGSVGHGIHIAANTVHNTLDACEAQDNNGHGVYIQGSHTIFSGIADSNNAGHGGDADRSGNGIHVDGASNCIITATSRDRGVNTRAQKYGLGLANGVEGLKARMSSSGNASGHVLGGFHSNVDITLNNYGTRDSRTFATSLTPDPTDGSIIQVGALTENITVNAPATANTWTGQRMTFRFTQDGSGGRTITFTSGYRTNWTPSTTANRVNTISFFYDGTSWIQESASVGIV